MTGMAEFTYIQTTIHIITTITTTLCNVLAKSQCKMLSITSELFILDSVIFYLDIHVRIYIIFRFIATTE